MKNQVVYSARGGGYSQQLATSSSMNGISFNGKATWPLAKLVLRQHDLRFSLNALLFGRIVCAMPYSEIQQVSISRSGYVQVLAYDPAKNFGFTWIGLAKILQQFKEAGVAIHPDAYKNLSSAQSSVTLQILFACVFLTFWVSALGFILGLVFTH